MDRGPGATDLAVGGVDSYRSRVPLAGKDAALGLGQPQREAGEAAVLFWPKRFECSRGRLSRALERRVGPVSGVERGLEDLDGRVGEEGRGGGEEVGEREASRRRRRRRSSRRRPRRGLLLLLLLFFVPSLDEICARAGSWAGRVPVWWLGVRF